MERAQALEARTSLAQLDGLADQIDKIELLLDFSGNANGRRGSYLPGGVRNLPDTRRALSSLDKALRRNSTP